jgi:hypothetical protein
VVMLVLAMMVGLEIRDARRVLWILVRQEELVDWGKTTCEMGCGWCNTPTLHVVKMTVSKTKVLLEFLTLRITTMSATVVIAGAAL